jgi:peptide/nickel transport system substrate-binding protein
LYSSFGEESGWQNPFGFTNLALDDRLDEQRNLEGDERAQLIADIQRDIVREQPFTVVAFADNIAGLRTDRFEGWPRGGPSQPVDYLRLTNTSEAETIDLLLQDSRITRNRNPVAVEHRDRGAITGLLYEPLLRRIDGERAPWLARDIQWTSDGTLMATVRLRETPWHDGRRVTPSDVTFTYAFLRDTSLGEFDTPVPTPWRRGRVTLVDDIEVLSSTELRIAFTTANRGVARRALEVPILPEHVWSEYTDSADVAGIDVAGQTTEALVWPNEEPVGTGPLQFASATPDKVLVLEKFEPHFLEQSDAEGIPSRFAGGLPFERARFRVVPSHGAGIEALENGEADATVDGLQASLVTRIARSSDVSLSVSRADSFYHLGYNCRRAPLSDPRFRQTVARLLDRDYLVDAFFGGYADASEIPLRQPWAPEDLVWDGSAELAFLGEGGELDVAAARDAFREAGYQYDDDRLVRRGES